MFVFQNNLQSREPEVSLAVCRDTFSSASKKTNKRVEKVPLTLVETRDLAVVDRAAPEPDVGHVAVEVAAAPRAEAEAQRRPVRLAREVERRQAVACRA